MSFAGLVPDEYLSGAEHRGDITHAGNANLRAQLVESACLRHLAIGTEVIESSPRAGAPPLQGQSAPGADDARVLIDALLS